MKTLYITEVLLLMLKLKVIISKLIWKIAGISPEWGNRVMDILGEENYCKVMRYQRM